MMYGEKSASMNTGRYCNGFGRAPSGIGLLETNVDAAFHGFEDVYPMQEPDDELAYLSRWRSTYNLMQRCHELWETRSLKRADRISVVVEDLLASWS